MEEFPSGQRGQTVNLLRLASVVRIHPPPPKKRLVSTSRFFISISDEIFDSLHIGDETFLPIFYAEEMEIQNNIPLRSGLG